jgi:hypothetical protein
LGVFSYILGYAIVLPLQKSKIRLSTPVAVPYAGQTHEPPGNIWRLFSRERVESF